MAYKRNIEIFEEAYEKKDAKSVVSYVARDGRRRYIAGNKNPDGGGNMPSGGGMVEVTWQELKDKRDIGELNPGSLYRITDYQCTTTQENTRSAGHQFDIVLLALSEDKLAEEGWAMMHDNIYDVTFANGVTKKCYLYCTGGNNYNVVDVSTLLGDESVVEGDGEDMTIDEENKTAIISSFSSTESENTQGLIYNYFQNSNLSAWKIWYCLDNDTARFAWADAGSDYIEISVSGENKGKFYRSSSDDTTLTAGGGTYNLYAWKNSDLSSDNIYYTWQTDSPIEDTVLRNAQGAQYSQDFTRIVKCAYKGRGVIYRLIDEWNNDVAYDFKNIQYFMENNWLYTMSNYGLPGDEIDVSVSSHGSVTNNYISKQINVDEGGEILGENILSYCMGCSVIGVNSRNNIVARGNTTLINCTKTMSVNGDSILIDCGEFTPEESGYYLVNKKVLTES